jgi:DNA-binding NtrC family response regulator
MANRVMIVEDESAIRKLAESVLTKDGYEVIAVPDAETALAAYRPGMYDCLVVDFLLGRGMTGVDLIKKIRENDHKVGIVMATGTVDMTELAVEGLSVWSCMRKPYEAKQLSLKVGQACELSNIGEEQMAAFGERIDHQSDRIRSLRSDLRSETTILPPGVMR